MLKVLDALKGKSEASEAPKFFFGNPFRTGVGHLEEALVGSKEETVSSLSDLFVNIPRQKHRISTS